jgi:signal transduction histidine kinase
MTADIAHDLRTPLSLILGHAEALSDGVLPPTPETLHVIYDEAQRLNRLIEDLRTLSLADTGELSINQRPYQPLAALQRTALVQAPLAQEKQIEMTVEAAESLPDVWADPDRLAQVLDNLVSNGLRYTPQNGRIHLSATLVGNEVQFAVQDSGPGILADDLSRVFHRFYRADKSRQRQEGGSGLGLAIARSIVEQHNGRIWVNSPPNSGATFVFTLPIA